MSDIISRAAALDAIFGCFNVMESKGIDMTVARTIVKGVLDGVPAVDAVPVEHARWIDHKDEHQCSACKEFTVVDAYVWVQLRYDFCPYCGAKMDGERRDEA